MGADTALIDTPVSDLPRPQSERGKLTGEQHAARQADVRRASALQALQNAMEESTRLVIPPPVTELVPRRGRVLPKLGVEAFELARQVYYIHHGSLTDAARAIIAANLSDTKDVVQVRERLQTWWARQEWPKRPTLQTFALRDAANDGGLFRSERLCIGYAVGGGPAPQGKKCPQSALPDSEYCFHHDPRPEYVAARRAQIERLVRSRSYDMVALGPFCTWMDRERRRLLADAKATRAVHPNNTGWSLLAEWLQISPTLVGRMMDGRHNGAAKRAGRRVRTIRASTVLRCLEPTGVAFKDIYGFEPPPRRDPAPTTCPSCGARKNPQSTVCRSCYEAEGTRCSYVNRAGRRCATLTKHPSGICSTCRKITERVHKPRTGRSGFLSAQMLILALGEYRDLPVHAWVARRMWSANAGGVRDVYKSQESLRGSLTKQFAKRGITSAAQAAAAYEKLTAEHSAPEWPVAEDNALEVAGMVPFAPFATWLAARHEELGSHKALAGRIGIHPDSISKWLRGVPTEKGTLRRATVERSLKCWGDGTAFADLYGEGESR